MFGPGLIDLSLGLRVFRGLESRASGFFIFRVWSLSLSLQRLTAVRSQGVRTANGAQPVTAVLKGQHGVCVFALRLSHFRVYVWLNLLQPWLLLLLLILLRLPLLQLLLLGLLDDDDDHDNDCSDGDYY